MTPSVHIADGRRTTRWSRETIVEKITDWHARHGEAPRSADWNPSLARWRAQEWRVERYYAGHWPSTNAVKRAFGGSFDAAVRAAGLEPARPGPRPRAAASSGAAAGAHRAAAELERRLAAAERRADRAESRLADARRRARLATQRAARARRARDRAAAEADARVGAALDQADAAVRDAEALRRAHGAPTRRPAGSAGPAGPAGPGPLAAALRRLAAARAAGDREGLRRELATVAAAALAWRDRL